MSLGLRYLAAPLVVVALASASRADLTINLRLTDGTTSQKVSVGNIGDVIPIQVWATVTNTVPAQGGTGTHEGLQYLFYSLQSHKLKSDDSGWILSDFHTPTLQSPFDVAGSQPGVLFDFSGDGVGDVGSTATTDSNTAYAKPRAASPVWDDSSGITGHVVAGGFEFLVETVNFQVHGVPAAPSSGAGTRIDPIPATFTNVATANWWENSTESPTTNGLNSGLAKAGTSINFYAISAWQNPVEPLDVNDSGTVTALDALNIINELNAHGTHALGLPSGGEPPPYYDTDGNNSISALDALLVINLLNNPPAVGGALPSMTALSMPSSVPEPSTGVMALLGLLIGAIGYGRSRILRK